MNYFTFRIFTFIIFFKLAKRTSRLNIIILINTFRITNISDEKELLFNDDIILKKDEKSFFINIKNVRLNNS